MPQAAWRTTRSSQSKAPSDRLLITAIACSEDDLISHEFDGKSARRLCQCSAHHLALPQLEAFAANDVILRATSCSSQAVSPILAPQHGIVPFNSPHQTVDFETPLFKGKLVVLFKGLPDTPVGIFQGKKRLMWMAVQGQFKQRVPFDSLMIGSEFMRSLKLPASSLLVRATQWLIHRMGTGVQLNPTGDNPHILAPLIAAAQAINVSLPGQQPDMLSAEEDMTLCDQRLVSSWSGKPMSAGKRRSFFASKTNRQEKFFDTEHVWTFQLYDQSMDYSTFTLPIPLFKLDLIQVLDGQPLQLMLKDVSSNINMMQFEVWHKRMLQHKANLNGGGSGSSMESTPTWEPTPTTPQEGSVTSDDGSIGSELLVRGLSSATSYSSCCSSVDGW